jgi:hybrid cluster-associated redox disulfide protein
MKEATMEYPQFTPNLTVAEVMDRWPQTIPTFFRYRMACVGCPIASFETLAEVAAIYGLELDQLINELQQTVQRESL